MPSLAFDFAAVGIADPIRGSEWPKFVEIEFDRCSVAAMDVAKQVGPRTVLARSSKKRTLGS